MTRPIAERFWEKVDKSGNCWMWTGATTFGYGAFWFQGRNIAAHRMALILEGEHFEHGDWACHRCDVRGCVRPSHLYIGNATTNNQDTSARNPASRLRKAETGQHISEGLRAHYAANPRSNHEARKTHCPFGHPYDEVNTAIYRGKRACRTCARRKATAWRNAHLELCRLRERAAHARRRAT